MVVAITMCRCVGYLSLMVSRQSPFFSLPPSTTTTTTTTTTTLTTTTTGPGWYEQLRGGRSTLLDTNATASHVFNSTCERIPKLVSHHNRPPGPGEMIVVVVMVVVIVVVVAGVSGSSRSNSI